MARGLRRSGAAHDAGLIHRDIKPANIWLETPTGRVKIVDFGLARLAKEDGQLTQTGTLMGTPAYMAPEQANGEVVDARCDLFSIGCVLYRMSTGQLPFRGKDTMSMLMVLASQTPEPLAKSMPACRKPSTSWSCGSCPRIPTAGPLRPTTSRKPWPRSSGRRAPPLRATPRREKPRHEKVLLRAR